MLWIVASEMISQSTIRRRRDTDNLLSIFELFNLVNTSSPINIYNNPFVNILQHGLVKNLTPNNNRIDTSRTQPLAKASRCLPLSRYTSKNTTSLHLWKLSWCKQLRFDPVWICHTVYSNHLEANYLGLHPVFWLRTTNILSHTQQLEWGCKVFDTWVWIFMKLDTISQNSRRLYT